VHSKTNLVKGKDELLYIPLADVHIEGAYSPCSGSIGFYTWPHVPLLQLARIKYSSCNSIVDAIHPFLVC